MVQQIENNFCFMLPHLLQAEDHITCINTVIDIGKIRCSESMLHGKILL